MSAADVVVFDLDGTLADTSGDLIAAANACFIARGLGALLDPEADALTAFQGGRAMLRLGYGRAGAAEGLAEADYPALLRYYDEAIAVQTRLYDGVEQALERLAQAGFGLSICTNKPATLAEKLTRALGIRDRFACLIGADTLPTRKPDPAPYRAAAMGAARSMLIGDTQTDRDTARACAVPCALVTFGPEGRAIARLAPEALLDHYDALPELAARLLRGAL